MTAVRGGLSGLRRSICIRDVPMKPGALSARFLAFLPAESCRPHSSASAPASDGRLCSGITVLHVLDAVYSFLQCTIPTLVSPGEIDPVADRATSEAPMQIVEEEVQGLRH